MKFHGFHQIPLLPGFIKNHEILWIFSKYPYYQDLLKIMELHEITACFLLIYWEILAVHSEFPGISPFHKYPYYYDPYTISWNFMNSQQICLLLRSLYKSMDLHEITACLLLIYWDNLTADSEYEIVSNKL